MAIDATGEFDVVRNQYISDSDPILALLEGVAEDAKTAVIGTSVASQLAYGAGLSDALDTIMEAEDGFTTSITDATSPTEPAQEDILSLATDYLDWLAAQAIAEAATFPTYTELEDTQPTEPTLDSSDPTLYTLEEIPAPIYDIPVWDDASAWSGGDFSTDPSLDAITAPFTWTGAAYASKLLVGGNNVLYDAIVADIQDDNYGVDDLDGGRIWDRHVERETVTAYQGIYEANEMNLAGGFSAPTGAASAALVRAQNAARDKISTAARDVLIQKSALYLDAKKVAQANGLQIETLEQGFYNAFNDRLLRIITQEITSTVEVATFNVERLKIHIDKYVAFSRVFAEQVSAQKGVIDIYTAEVNAQSTKAQMNTALIEQITAKNKNLIDNYMAQIDGFKAVMDGRVRYHNVLADVYKSQVGNINKHMESTQGAYDLVDKQHKTKVEFALGKFTGDIANTKAKLDELLGYTAHKIDHMKAEMQAAASVAAAAMSALNVNLGLSLGANTSISGSENHSYDETKGENAGRTTSYVHSHDETKSTNPGTITQEITYSGGTDNQNENTNYNYQGEI